MVKMVHLARRAGNRRRIIRLRKIKPALADRRELQAIIRDIVEAVFGHKEELLAEYERLIGEPRNRLVGDVLYLRDSMDDINRVMRLLVTQTNRAMTRVEIRLNKWGRQVESRHHQQFNANLLAAANISYDTMLHPGTQARTVGHYLAWSTSLIRDVGDEARKRIADAVLEGARAQRPIREVARALAEAEQMSLRRARNIAADQTTKLNAALDQARQREVGIDHFTWVHSGAANPRPEHMDRDGEVFSWDDDEIDAGDFPGEPPFCGCIAQATIVDEDLIASPGEGEGEDLAVEEQNDRSGRDAEEAHRVAVSQRRHVPWRLRHPDPSVALMTGGG